MDKNNAAFVHLQPLVVFFLIGLPLLFFALWVCLELKDCYVKPIPTCAGHSWYVLHKSHRMSSGESEHCQSNA